MQIDSSKCDLETYKHYFLQKVCRMLLFIFCCSVVLTALTRCSQAISAYREIMICQAPCALSKPPCSYVSALLLPNT